MYHVPALRAVPKRVVAARQPWAFGATEATRSNSLLGEPARGARNRANGRRSDSTRFWRFVTGPFALNTIRTANRARSIGSALIWTDPAPFVPRSTALAKVPAGVGPGPVVTELLAIDIGSAPPGLLTSVFLKV